MADPLPPAGPEPVGGGFPPDEGNPWRTLRSREVYANPWLRLTEHDVIRPDGEPGLYGIVEPTNLALGVVPLTPEGEVWLVGQYRYALDCYSWEIPEGGGDPSCDPREEAARELLEETGLVAERWSQILELHTSNSFTAERAIVFLAEGLRQEKARPEGSERLQIARVPLPEAITAIHEGRITDAISVAALLAVAAGAR